jgi:enterochelin esterase-like enzyme
MRIIETKLTRYTVYTFTTLLGLFIIFGTAVYSLTAQKEAAAQTSVVQYESCSSASLNRELKYAIQLPTSYQSDSKKRYPVLYFLHGMHGSETDFERRGIAQAVIKMREDKKIGDFIIVSPKGENSFYINSKNGVRYEDAIIKDLIPHIDKTYRTLPVREGRAIQGISMGGFGSLLIAFKHPQIFSSVTAHCAAIFPDLPQVNGENRRSQFIRGLIGNIFGDPPDEKFFKDNNPIYIAEQQAAAIRKNGLKIYFDVGEQDRYGLQEGNKTLSDRLTKAAVPHEFHVFPGGHGWEYMLSVGDNSYKFLWKHFDIAKR